MTFSRARAIIIGAKIIGSKKHRLFLKKEICLQTINDPQVHLGVNRYAGSHMEAISKEPEQGEEA